ncbi:MAG: ATP-grasp domain-containing protein [Opitutales bacterium]
MHLADANKSHKKTILVLAGSQWQIPIVLKIHKMGLLSLVINLHEDSPAFKFADYWEVADILDKEKCLAIAEKYAVSGVVSEQCDIAVPTVAYIAEKLGLPALKSDSAELYTNKLSMREFCQKHGFSYPEYSLCRNSDEVLNFFNKTKREIIIKPLDANSSRGIHSIDNKANIPKCFSDAVSYSKQENAVIAERYISGPEFTVDGIVADGKHHSLAVSIKSHYQHNKNIAYELFFSHLHEQYDYDLLRRINDRFIEKSKLREGTLTHSEYKFEDGKFYLIETAARGGGNLVASHLVPLISGFDNYQYYLNTAIGATNRDFPKAIHSSLKERCAVLHFFTTPAPSGVVTAIEGKEFLDSSPKVIAFRLNFTIGDTINEAANDASRIGFYIAYAETRDKLLSFQRQISQRFSIRMEPL